MAYIKRDIEALVLDTSKEYAGIMITGPRQVGKTTMLRQLMDDSRRYVTLDDMDERKMAKEDPALFLSLHPVPVLIDEVQYAPELFSYIKIAIDNGAAPGDFWLTGSQSFRLMELAQESLAGRIAIFHLTALSQHEIYGSGKNTPFILELSKLQERAQRGMQTDVTGIYQRIWNGAMPGMISGKYTNRETFYSSYLQSYIERDVSDMVERIDKLGFLDFIRAAACRCGQLLNIHDIASDVGCSADTAKRWLGILEKSDVIFYLRPYSNNLLKRTIKTPKLYFFDTGLVAYLTKYSSPEILVNGAINGAILENYAVAEIRKSYTNAGMDCLMHYYRDRDSKEVDVVIEADGELHPLEIKKSTRPGSELTSTFKVLDASSVPRGTGAILCLREELSAVDRQNYIVPIWMI
ncbi:ATP-binding protein [Lutispora saccharofermentans]|uniref:ATP-binding protein n=1 Tax=Lutispora saccharofermentans TaxID=3024236 RepID=A0ABT1NGV0_9FIRM|nr:ATP-binding protein [Lutispora saccharofermentans]MCQ1530459.1 ATP-binding protein [Lutispora saccharofermentans]